MYFVGLLERENMMYQARVEALRCWFGQETDTSIALPELASLRRGKNQFAKEFADSAKRLASRAYYSNDYTARKKARSMSSRPAVGEELHLKCVEQGCKTLEIAVGRVEIQERYTQRAVWALRTEESEVTTHLKAMGERLEELIGEIRDDCEQQKQWAERRESTRQRKADME